ncbi:hypothetical protein [Clostridium estertheticum]|nr:hypothetical protein [Clostridium estertheticum]MBZ9614300.1 hypothetical protein [Clostridium estertheticum subsp. laramiense]
MGGINLIDKNISCVIGEHYVLCELLRNEFQAYIANGSTQEGWDIIVILKSKVLKLQVKTAQWIDKGTTAINGKFSEDNYDFLVIVLINFCSEKYTTFIISKNELEMKNEKYSRGLINMKNNKVLYTNKTITLNNLKDNSTKKLFCNLFQNKWGKFK